MELRTFHIRKNANIICRSTGNVSARHGRSTSTGNVWIHVNLPQWRGHFYKPFKSCRPCHPRIYLTHHVEEGRTHVRSEDTCTVYREDQHLGIMFYDMPDCPEKDFQAMVGMIPWSSLGTIMELTYFILLDNFYRKFVPNFACIASILQNAKRRSSEYTKMTYWWNQEIGQPGT